MTPISAFPTAEDPVYVVNGDADELIYIHKGGGTLRSLLGDVAFAQGDYVVIPRGLLHRFLPQGEQHWFWFSLSGGLHLPKQWRNEVGQLRMDAPYSERDFKRPELRAPFDEKIRSMVVRRDGVWHGFTLEHTPFDVVGWDGAVYPWAFPLFVPLIEEGWFDHPATELIAREYLAPLRDARVDTLVLGCTHYPLIKPLLGRVLGPEVRLIDSAEETAVAVRDELSRRDLLAPGGGPAEHRFVVSDDEPRFRAVGARFLGERLQQVEVVPLG